MERRHVTVAAVVSAHVGGRCIVMTGGTFHLAGAE